MPKSLLLPSGPIPPEKRTSSSPKLANSTPRMASPTRNSGSNASDDGMRSILEDPGDDPLDQTGQLHPRFEHTMSRSIWWLSPGSVAATAISKIGTNFARKPPGHITTAQPRIFWECRHWPTIGGSAFEFRPFSPEKKKSMILTLIGNFYPTRGETCPYRTNIDLPGPPRPPSAACAGHLSRCVQSCLCSPLGGRSAGRDRSPHRLGGCQAILR